MDSLIRAIESNYKRNDMPEFRAGDTVRVQVKVVEGGRERLQAYEGIVIKKRGAGMGKSFTVRRIGADRIGVERVFPMNTPLIDSVEVVRKGKVRRAKLYYLRNVKGKIKIKERRD
ncbi:50S ribosomal protein L19 [Oceanotoga sp. DSM 15011]|jgi:large subunit ribosomal protein L19|uniref:50S ribosomal protein L19 n=1 Tax=unclassified Oceanotoga TaxID=2618448 RepID=UPI0021F4064F|nr:MULTISPECIES: 50S ribosomal protein L19 [unclassified Oceanotoga]MDN5342183.1 large subunit ribosomal protein [Oceanotoga sp.]UYP01026.1 50S ribosomal protein L19 [Oceanotoga sp. DSM 15011]